MSTDKDNNLVVENKKLETKKRKNPISRRQQTLMAIDTRAHLRKKIQLPKETRQLRLVNKNQRAEIKKNLQIKKPYVQKFAKRNDKKSMKGPQKQFKAGRPIQTPPTLSNKRTRRARRLRRMAEKTSLITSEERIEQKKTEMMDESAKGGKDLGDAEFLTTVEQSASQRNTIPISVEADLANVKNLGATWAAFFMSMYIGMTDEDITVETDSGLMGQLYLCAATITADLLYAMAGQISIFASAPEQYVELRQALQPKMRGDIQYVWTFNGGSSINNIYGDAGVLGTYPLVVGKLNLSWPVNITANQTVLNTTVPVLSDNLIATVGLQTVSAFWATLALRDDKNNFKLVAMEQPTGFTESVAAFAYSTSINEGENVNWCTAFHEIKIPGPEYWLVFLGIGQNPVPEPNVARQGPWSASEYVSPFMHYGLRLQTGVKGRVPKVVPRPKYIYLENIVALATTSLVWADLNYNSIAGESVINQASMTKSVCATIGAADWVHALCAAVVYKLWSVNWLSMDNTINNDSEQIMFGATFDPGLQASTLPLWFYIIERLGCLRPLKINRRNGAWSMVTFPVLVASGNFYANLFQSSTQGNPDTLEDYITHLSPDAEVSFGFNNESVSGMSTYIDVFTQSICQFKGQQMLDAFLTYTRAVDTLQGNCMTGPVGANQKYMNTLLHYTQIVDTYIGDIENWTSYPSFSISHVTNKVDFNPNVVAFDMSAFLPIMAIPYPLLQTIYNEHSSVYYRPDEMQSAIGFDLVHGVKFTHELLGGDDESNLIDRELIAQGAGGGIVPFIMSALGSLASAV